MTLAIPPSGSAAAARRGLLAAMALCCMLAAPAAQTLSCAPAKFLNATCLPHGSIMANLSYTTEADCCAHCAATPGCVAWNTNRGQMECFLRSSAGDPKPGEQCTSGIKPSPPPPPPSPAPAGSKNLLVIICDDMRPMFPPFTDKYGVQAPNLAKLAASSMVFHNSYVQEAVCSPSRNSFLSGRRPDSTRIWNFQGSFRTLGLDTAGVEGAKWTSFPEAFKTNGYNTVGMGKIFHPGHPKRNDCNNPHPSGGAPVDCLSWSTSFHTPNPQKIVSPDGFQLTQCMGDNCSYTYYQPDAQIGACHGHKQGKEWDPTNCDLPDENCTDLWQAETAVKVLRSVSADKTRPFAMFLGFHKPHPFWALPMRFQDQYRDTLPLPTHMDAPLDAPEMAYYSCTSVNHCSNVGGPNCDDPVLNPPNCSYIMPNETYADKYHLRRLSEPVIRDIRAGYAGGITWTDLQIGKVLDELDALKLSDDTAVVYFADHGWALGELGMYCKMANYELQTRVPTMIRAPWLGASAVGSTTSIVELVDMYPTAMELVGLSPSALPDALEGTSVVPLLHNSSQPWKKAAFSQYPRCMNSTVVKEAPFLANEDPCIGHPGNQFTHMGYCMRTDEWRYCEWPVWKCQGSNNNSCTNTHQGLTSADWDDVAGVELYDHRGDDGSCFDCFETVNVAFKPENADLVKTLSKQLRSGWTAALPPATAPAKPHRAPAHP